MANNSRDLASECKATPSGRADGYYHRGPLEELGEGAQGEGSTAGSKDQGSEVVTDIGRLLRLVRKSVPPPPPQVVSRRAKCILDRIRNG